MFYISIHIKVCIIVPKVDLTFIIDHLSDTISYYALFNKYSLPDLHINIMRIFGFEWDFGCLKFEFSLSQP